MANWTWNKHEDDTLKMWFRSARQVLALCSQYIPMHDCYFIFEGDKPARKKLSEARLKTALTEHGMGISVRYPFYKPPCLGKVVLEVMLSKDHIEFYIASSRFTVCETMLLEKKKMFNHILATTHLILEGNDFWYSSISDNSAIIHHTYHTKMERIFVENGLMDLGREVR